MPNPFLNWTSEMVAAHNARVSAKEPDSGQRPGGTMTGATPVPPGTNLVPVKTTDEEKLNKLERDWLRQLRLTHTEVHIQAMTLKLADDTRYTPDFHVIDPNGQLVCYETKGHMRDDARVKIFVAARTFLHFRFVLVTREQGQWNELPVKP